MSTYLAAKYALLHQALRDNPSPVMPIHHGPSDLQALADHAKEIAFQFTEYMFAIAREAQGLHVDTDPMEVTACIRGAIHDSSLIEAIEAQSETMLEDIREAALENA